MSKSSILLFSLAVSGACAVLVEQVSLSFGSSPSEMVVSFAASTGETTAECRYGTDPNNLSNTITATGSKYSMLNYTSPMLFKASMTDLKDGNEIYYYSVGSETLGFSEPKSFKSHPGVGVEDVTFHIFGDIGQTNNSQSTLAELVSYESDLTGKSGGIISMGDLSYANGNQPEWDTFGNFVTYASDHIPMLTTLGNHEWFDSPNHDFKAYLARFTNPPVASGERELYYSFDSGLVHWVMIAGYCQNMWTVRTQPCLAEGSPQMDWLTKDLAVVDRTVTPWVVAVFHQPYVNSNEAHSMETEGAPMQKAVEDVLNAYNVDLVFSGHVHSYERSCQVYQYNCQAGAPYYITIGDGGNAEGLASNWVEPQPAWSSFRQASYGFGELRVVDSNTMVWRWHQNQDLLPVIADEFTFTKQKQQGGLRGSTTDNGASKPITGQPVFANNERGRRAAEFNAERTKLSSRANKH